VIKALGLTGELPLAAAFVILALYTYSAGLRAPALIAFVKDLMIYIVVLVAVVLVPMKLGGYAHVFDVASAAYAAKKSGGLLLKPAQYLPYATLALGSAMAAFMYPHTLTGIFAAKSADTIRKNAVFLPAYTVLLGLIALLGYMAYAAGVDVHGNNNAVVPALFTALFPSWFVGFAFAAIAIGALVPAAVMSIGAANLFTRNFWKAYVQPNVSPAGEAKVAKLVSLVVKVGALVIILVLPTKFALDLQLLGGVWILQTFPAVVFGLFFAWFRAPALLLGWAVGLATGTSLAFMDGVKPVHTFTLGGDSYAMYTGLFALAVNIVVASIAQVALGDRGSKPAPAVR
jgi:SSS family solute:Na+ symporter